MRLLDQVAVKGKVAGTRVYEVLGRQHEVTDQERAIATAQTEAFERYFKRQFSAAAAAFKRAGEMFLAERGYSDAAAELLEARCLDYAGQNPPPEDWNGTEVLKQKHF